MKNEDLIQAVKQLPSPYSTFTACLSEASEVFSASAGQTHGPQASQEMAQAGGQADPEKDARHLWSAQEVLAVVQAWASDRPLLVRGEAGCGKSQMAKALAVVLQVPLFHDVVHGRFEATDLLYRMDHVARLAKAQILGAMARPQSDKADKADESGNGVLAQVEAQLEEQNFVIPGVLLQAYRHEAAASSDPRWPRAVVLIDEIDKADVEVPNALLKVLGDRSIKLPGQQQEVRCDTHRPLVIITTNEDRELPAAFVRRCAVLNLAPPSNDHDFLQWLQARARAHKNLTALDQPVPDQEKTVLELAAEMVLQDRKAAKDSNLATVGLAEYLDLLYALCNVSQGRLETAHALLAAMAPYALRKHRNQVQHQDQESAP